MVFFVFVLVRQTFEQLHTKASHSARHTQCDTDLDVFALCEWKIEVILLFLTLKAASSFAYVIVNRNRYKTNCMLNDRHFRSQSSRLFRIEKPHLWAEGFCLKIAQFSRHQRSLGPNSNRPKMVWPKASRKRQDRTKMPEMLRT